MSFFKKLFGGSARDEQKTQAGEMHGGYVITPTPMADGGQYRLCAEIRKEIDGEIKVHKLIRADLFSTADQAAEASRSKAKQVIKEQGDRMFI